MFLHSQFLFVEHEYYLKKEIVLMKKGISNLIFFDYVPSPLGEGVGDEALIAKKAKMNLLTKIIIY